MMGFYVCESVPQRRVRIHRSDCPHCRGGQGRPKATPSLETTHWSKEFSAFPDAQNHMVTTFPHYRDLGECEKCWPSR